MAGIARDDGARYQPPLHDRHTFAVHRLTGWIKRGADLKRIIPALSAYIGQVGRSSTDRYLALTPERFQSSPPQETIAGQSGAEIATLFTDDMAKLAPQLAADVSKTSALEISQTSSVGMGIGIGI
jgi:hypothetical protein